MEYLQREQAMDYVSSDVCGVQHHHRLCDCHPPDPLTCFAVVSDTGCVGVVVRYHQPDRGIPGSLRPASPAPHPRGPALGDG